MRARRLIPLLAVIAVAAPAGAVTLTPTGDPLPGSTFEGADGNQTASRAGRADWAELQAQSRVLAVPDPNAADDAFAGGTKDYNPGNWSFKTANGGVTPGGTNVLDAYASVDQVGPTTFLYLSATRHSDTGTSYVSFELNRDSRRWYNGHAFIPCRRTGDLDISYQPHGSTQTVVVRRWVTTTPDSTTGCARVGTLEDAPLQANVQVQGAFNASALVSSLPGQGTNIAARLFSETAINLTSVLSGLGGSCRAFTSFWVYSHSSESPTSNMSDIVQPRPLDVRTCSASGTKFLDADADGVRDPGEPGLEGFKIFADYDNNGVDDEDEPFAYTDAQGNYVIDGIERTSYTLRETLPGASNPQGWRCSYPNASVTVPAGATATAPGGLFPCGWHVDRTAEAYAQGRDFGNWRPARLTLEKRVFPEDDETHFTLHHPGRDDPFDVTGGSSVGGDLPLQPGTYTTSEVAAPGFVTHVTCELDGETVVDVNGTQAQLTLAAGDHAVCRFYNARVGAPGIRIVKGAPNEVAAGETIHYTFRVTNIGSIPLAADDVVVRDPRCASGPHRTGASAGDDTLAPGERWTYTCTRATEDPGPGCVSHEVENTASVTAGEVSDGDTATVSVRCPQPEIAVVKTGEATAAAGSTVRFVFWVYNTGDTSFAAAGVSVADEQCEADPVVGEKLNAALEADASPRTFDPGDVWAFTCLSVLPSRAPDGECKDFISTNRATAAATTRGLSATAQDTFDTAVTCTPPGPPVTPEPPPEPGPVLPLPEAPVPPDPVGGTVLGTSTTGDVASAGVSGTAGLRSPAVPHCLERGSIVVLNMERVASVDLSFKGRPVRGVEVRPLQTRVVIRVRRDVPPGRHRIRVVIRFQNGAGTQPLRFSRNVYGCAAAVVSPAPPAVTG